MGGGGGKGGTSTSTVSIPPEVLARYNAVNAQAQQLAGVNPTTGQPNTPFQQYGGEFVAPVNAVQQQGISQVAQSANAAQPYYQGATTATLGAMNQAAPLTPQQIQQYQNPYTQSVVDPTLKALQQQQAIDQNQLTANQIRSGAYGGDRSGISQAALRGQQELATGQAIAPLYQQGYQNALQAAQQQQQLGVQTGLAGGAQLGQLGTAAQQAGVTGGQAALAAGTVPQQTQQALDTALYQQFLQQQGYPFQLTQFLANIAEGTGALSGSTTTSTQPSGFFSDRRLKKDIKEIGKTHDGQPIYKFKYNNDNTPRIGLMAQDVEKKHPKAVGVTGGYKFVDYDAATKDAERPARATGGVIPANSEGGAVWRAGAYADGGMLPRYATSGGSNVDPNDWASLIAAHGQLGAPYGGAMGAKGMFGGAAAGTPGGPGRVPSPSLAVPRLLTSNFQPRQQPSGMSTAIQTGSQVANLAQGASKGYDWLTKTFGDEKSNGGRIHKLGGGGINPYDAPTDPEGKLTYFPTEDLESGSQMAQLAKQAAPGPGKTPDKIAPATSGMQSLLGTGSQIYGTAKMAGAAKDFLGGLGGVGEKTMTSFGNPITSASEVGPFMSEAPAGVAQGLGATGALNPVGSATMTGVTSAADVGPFMSQAPTALAATAPLAETTAAVAPEALAGAAGGAEALGAAGAAGEGIMDILPMFAFLKTGGVVPSRKGYQQAGVVAPSDTPDYDPQADLPAPNATDVALKSDDQHPADKLFDTRVIPQESGGKQFDKSGNPLTSKAGAVGVSQVMPGTAPEAAKLAGVEFDEDKFRNDPDYNKKLGQAYFRAQWDRFGGDPEKAMAAYNAGPGNVDKALAREAQTGVSWKNYLPNETKNYIGVTGADRGDQTASVGRGSSLGDVFKSATPDFIPSGQNFWIPAASFLGSMLSSRNPSFGGALGEGLLGGVSGYMSLQKQENEMAKNIYDLVDKRFTATINPDTNEAGFFDSMTGQFATPQQKSQVYYNLLKSRGIDPGDYGFKGTPTTVAGTSTGAGAPSGAPSATPAAKPTTPAVKPDTGEAQPAPTVSSSEMTKSQLLQYAQTPQGSKEFGLAGDPTRDPTILKPQIADLRQKAMAATSMGNQAAAARYEQQAQDKERTLKDALDDAVGLQYAKNVSYAQASAETSNEYRKSVTGKINSNAYGTSETDLTKFADIASGLQTGKGSETFRDAVSALKTFLPDSVSSRLLSDKALENPANYDEALKLAMKTSVENMANDKLIRAPKAGLQAELARIPNPSQDPGAVYALTGSYLGRLRQSRDLDNAYLDAPPGTDPGKFARDWLATHDLKGYIRDAFGEIPANPNIPASKLRELQEFYKGPNGETFTPKIKGATGAGGTSSGGGNLPPAGTEDGQVIQTVNGPRYWDKSNQQYVPEYVYKQRKAQTSAPEAGYGD
jgi:Transglycosylase SLT domain/Chaperone of endosialidase